LLIGLTGKPSGGKSTIFSALTLINIPISPRPFTTIDPNKGTAFIRSKCPCSEFGIKCNPKNSKCVNGERLIPINVVDLAGLVPGAHEGKGLGNKFLDDVRTADALIQIVDVSGKTDAEGNPCEFYDPADEIIFLENEIVYWIIGIIKRAYPKIKGKNIHSFSEILSGLKVTEDSLRNIFSKFALNTERMELNDSDIEKISRDLRERCMPIIIAANKIDIKGAKENFEKLKFKFPERTIIPTYADGELALRKAEKNGLIEYDIGANDFKMENENKMKNEKINEKQKEALEGIRKVMKEFGGTGVQTVLEKTVFDILNLIIVYPVSDESKYTDNFGNVLPDALLVKKDTTVIEFAGKIHTDLAKNFVTAIDAKTKMKLARDHVLKDGDIIRIVSGK